MKVARTVMTMMALLVGVSTASAEELKVGVELPLTGPYARTGKALLEGTQTYIEIFNRSNPKHKVKLTVMDDETNVSKAISAVEKLSAEGNLGIIGGFSTRLSAPAAATAAKEELAFVTVGATGQDILERGHKTFFRLNNFEGYDTAIIQFVLDMGIKKVSMLTMNAQGNIDPANDIKKRLGAKGVKVVEHRFDPGVTDFKPLLNKVKVQDQPELLLLNCLEAENIGILRAAKIVRPNVKAVIGMYSIATSKMANEFPDLVQNVFAPSLVSSPAEFRTSEGKEFERAFKKLFNKEPDYLNQLGYVKGQVMIEAMKRAAEKKSLNKATVVKELRTTNRSTLIGKVTFDERGDNTNFRIFLSQHQPGKKIPLVYPREVANAKMNYPAVPW